MADFATGTVVWGFLNNQVPGRISRYLSWHTCRFIATGRPFLSPPVLLFDQYFDQLSTHPDIRALVITGHQEDVFSAGVDVTPTDKFITDMFQALEGRDKETLKEGFAFIQNVLSKLAHLQIPNRSRQALNMATAMSCLS